jgi:hypothetical protein
MNLSIDDFLSAIEQHFKTSLDTQEYQIDLGEWVNTSPEIASKGWVGLYHQDISFEPGALGSSSVAWRGEIHLALVVQNADYRSGRECTLELQRRIRTVLTTFARGSYMTDFVDALRGVEVSFSFDNAEAETVYFQTAVIDVTLAFNTAL